MKLQLIAIMTTAVFVASGDTTAQPTLKEAFQDKFLIGAALNPAQFTKQNSAQVALITNQFNSITAENVMKWEKLHPESDRYDFGPADRFVEFGTKHGMAIIGHTLVWHSQTPAWVFTDGKGGPADRATLLARMSNHVHTVVGRYKGRVKGWDVVNEALNENGSLRQSPWLRIIGEDYLVKAFEFAHAADPEAELYYNDYGLEDEAKRQGALTIIKQLQAAGVELSGVGVQGHYGLDGPSISQIQDTIKTFAETGLKVMITELDVNALPTPMQAYSAEITINYAADPKWNPHPDGLPQELDRRLAQRYEELFKLFVQERQSLTRVTFWGVTDGDSWLNDWPIHGRVNYPLLFGRDGRPKAAFKSVIGSRDPALGYLK